jgi:short-subunit dehydrogenase
MDIDSQCALITGASSGIGRELARTMAADGYGLILVARRRDRLDELAAELTGRHRVTVSVLAEDLADPAAPRRIEDQVRAAGREVDVLVNNAGFGSHGAFARADLDVALRMIDVNVRALVELTHRFLPPMLQRRRGRILNVASIAGFVPGPFMATYYASKAYVLSFTEALATELRGSGVTATASCPGPVATEFGEVAGSSRTNLFRGRLAGAAPVARHAYRAMLAGKVVAIPGLWGKLSAFMPRMSPRGQTRAIVAWMNEKRA